MSTAVEKVYKEIGGEVIRLRERVEMTQEALAHRLPFSRSTLANLERGRCRIMLHDLIPLARSFGMSPRKFLAMIPSLNDGPRRKAS